MNEVKVLHKHPVCFFGCDIIGEKDFEGFYTDNEVLDMNRFESIGVIMNQPGFDSAKFNMFSDTIAKMRNINILFHIVVLMQKVFKS